jgi:ABC-type amino acid transport substrate-binding protein
MRTVLAAVSSLALLVGCAQALPSREAVAQLAPSGTLRVGVLTSNPLTGRRVGDELKGTTRDLGVALARNAGVPIFLIEYSSLASMMDTPRMPWDVAAMVVEPAYRQRVDYAPPHIVSGSTSVAFALPKGRFAAAEHVSKWIEEAKASGAVQRAIDAAGLGARARVAPYVAP